MNEKLAVRLKRIGKAAHEVGTGFHPELTGRENVFLNGAILGMSIKEIKKKFDEIADFSGVEKFLDTPVKRYSSGMQVRLAFAVAAHLEPEILLIDEVLAVGDIAFQRKCLGKMNEVAYQGRTVIFVSHQMEMIASLCQRCILLQDGMLIKDGSPRDVINAYTAQTMKRIPYFLAFLLLVPLACFSSSDDASSDDSSDDGGSLNISGLNLPEALDILMQELSDGNENGSSRHRRYLVNC